LPEESAKALTALGMNRCHVRNPAGEMGTEIRVTNPVLLGGISSHAVEESCLQGIVLSAWHVGLVIQDQSRGALACGSPHGPLLVNRDGEAFLNRNGTYVYKEALNLARELRAAREEQIIRIPRVGGTRRFSQARESAIKTECAQIREGG
jgi:hypothetical protein